MEQRIFILYINKLKEGSSDEVHRTMFKNITNGKESTVNRALGGSTYPG